MDGLRGGGANASPSPHPAHRLREPAAGEVLGALDEQDDLVVGDEGVDGFLELGREGRVWGEGEGKNAGGCFGVFCGEHPLQEGVPRPDCLIWDRAYYCQLQAHIIAHAHLRATGWRSPPGPGGRGAARALRRRRRRRGPEGAGHAPRSRASPGGPALGGMGRSWSAAASGACVWSLRVCRLVGVSARWRQIGRVARRQRKHD